MEEIVNILFIIREVRAVQLEVIRRFIAGCGTAREQASGPA